jgi:FKBP-type peptidyl-prolyl cis-trans isomerase FkpA
MKKVLLFVLAGIVIFSYFSCEKAGPSTPSCTSVAPSADSAKLIAFAGDSILLTKDSTGLYYHIIDSGSGERPVFSSTITVNYVGRLMNNTIFDSASHTNLMGAGLYNLIAGWQIGMPKIAKGGHIQLFIPSALAWGCTGNGSTVPANAPVFFDVELIDLY